LEYWVVVAAYLLGSIPFALILVRVTTGLDVRRKGSGNVGATNAARMAGWGVGVLVAVLDVGKGAAPVLVMTAINPSGRWVGATAVAAVVGHCFPVWLGFRGGKGVATGVGAFLAIAPAAVAGALVVWVIVLVLRRVVSLASMTASAAFPILLFFLRRQDPYTMGAAVAVAVVIVIRHHSNIRRLLAGTEPDIHEMFPRKGKGGQS